MYTYVTLQMTLCTKFQLLKLLKGCENLVSLAFHDASKLTLLKS